MNMTVSSPASDPLARHVLARANDAQQCWREATRLVMPHILRAKEDGQPFGWAFHAVQLGETMLAFHSFRSIVEIIASDPMDSFYAFVLLSGSMAVSTEHGNADLAKPGAACVVSPNADFRCSFTPGTQQLLIKIPTDVVEQGFGRLTGEGGGRNIVFEVPGQRNSVWPRALRLAVQTVDNIDSGFPLPPLMGTELERLLVSSLLLSQPHSASDFFARPMTGRATRAASLVARAVTDAPEQDIDFAEMARAHGVSLRTLQDGFRDRFGRPPSLFLRDARLDKAHRMLTGNVHLTVTDAALSSGFTHLGRFARDFRLRYGYSPSTMQGRARQRSATPDL